MHGATVAPVAPVGRVACGALPCRAAGDLFVSAVAKASFALVQGQHIKPLDPAPLVASDVPASEQPASSLRAASDRVPGRPQVDVLLAGRAYAARVRLRVDRGAERVLIDKDALVRPPPAAAASLDPRRPTSAGSRVSVPLVYELAAGGAACRDNPAGRADPQMVHPRRWDMPIGFGPISPIWPARTGLLTDAHLHALIAPILALSSDFPWAFFHVAPPDQRTPSLIGDEWIYLEGVFPDIAWMQARLLGAPGEAQVLRAGGAVERAALFADTLILDAEERVCSIVFHGQIPMADLSQLSPEEVKRVREQPALPFQALAVARRVCRARRARRVSSPRCTTRCGHTSAHARGAMVRARDQARTSHLTGHADPSHPVRP